MTTAALRRNKKARDFKFFESFIKDPVAIGAGFVMPANGRLGISAPAGGVVSATIDGRVFTSPALPAGGVFRIDWVEKGKTITALTAGANLLVFDEWMNNYPIVV